MKGDMTLRYFICETDSNISFHPVYYIATSDWFTETDILSFLVTVWQDDMSNSIEDDDIEDVSEDEDLYFSVKNMEMIKDAEYFSEVVDSNYVDLLSVFHLDNLDEIFAVGRHFKNVEDEKHYVFSAEANQEPEVISLGKTDKDNPMEEVFTESYNDCMRQLKRYFSVSGLDVCGGTFSRQYMSKEAWEHERNSRDFVLA